jgi:AP-2 complex subunit alpha
VRPGQPLHEHFEDLLDLVYTLLIADLQSTDENFNCLAIQFIANQFNSIEYKPLSTAPNANWLQVIDMVYSTCTSPITSRKVKQKASLALHSLFKLYPNVVVTNTTWIPRLLSLVDNEDLGVITALTPLVQYVVSLQPKFARSILPSISSRLYSLVVEESCPETYFYYNCPAPWLCIKLLQMVESFYLESIVSISDFDANSLSQLQQVVARSIQNASQPNKNLQTRNCHSAILFQAVSLSVFLQASPDAIVGAKNALVMLLDSNDSNTKYLALDALIKLTSRLDSQELRFDANLLRIFHLLNDRDISVRRKSLDLICTVCNPQTYNKIIQELLEYFPVSEFSIKPDLAIKIAVLAENFATDSTWYVTTMLKLLSIGGGISSNGLSYISNEVWERIVQIVINNEQLQETTCKLIINLLKKSTSTDSHQPAMTSEALIKVAAIVLGEFGNQIDCFPEYKVSIQFKLLYANYIKVSLVSRAMMLSTFLKFLVKFPEEEIVPDIVDLFEAESQSMDLEIQTRAFEYLRLATMDSKALAAEVVKPLPFYSQKTSPLMTRIGLSQKLLARNRSSSMVLSKYINSDQTQNESQSDENLNPFEIEQEEAINLSSNWYAGFHRMLHYDAGIFYENQLIKITYRFVKEGYTLRMKLTFINNSLKSAGTNITGFNILNIESGTPKENPSYVLKVIESPEPSFSAKSAMDVEIKVRNIVELKENPILSFTFTCGGSFNQLNLKFPVNLLKCISSSSTPTVDEFNKRWAQVSEQLGVEKGGYLTNLTSSHRYNSSNISRMLSRSGFAIVHETHDDDSQKEISVLAAGILHTQNANYGVLASIRSTDNIGRQFDIDIRCTGGGVAEIISLELKEILEGSI